MTDDRNEFPPFFSPRFDLHFGFCSNQEKILLEEIRKNEEEIKRLKAEVDIILKEYNEMKSLLEGQVNKLESEIGFYDSEVVKNQAEIDEITPSYNQLCQVFEQKTAEYDDVRQKLISKYQQLTNGYYQASSDSCWPSNIQRPRATKLIWRPRSSGPLRRLPRTITRG